MVNKLSLSTGLAVATVAMGAFTQAAEAASFNFAYTLGTGETLSGMLEGEVQGDNDTVVVSDITMLMFDGSPLFDIGFIAADSNFTPPGIVSLTGTPANMDIIACPDSDCFEGFLFNSTSFLSSFAGNEAFAPSNWSLTAKSVESVPEPSTIISLAMVGGSLLLSKRVKRG